VVILPYSTSELSVASPRNFISPRLSLSAGLFWLILFNAIIGLAELLTLSVVNVNKALVPVPLIATVPVPFADNSKSEFDVDVVIWLSPICILPSIVTVPELSPSIHVVVVVPL